MNTIIHPETGEKINIFSRKGKNILKNYIKYYTHVGSELSSSRRSSRLKRQRDDDEEIMPRKIIKTHEYTFNINPYCK